MSPNEDRETRRIARREALAAELGRQADPISRRRFLELLGASLALAGASACAPPRDQIVPYVRPPEEAVPGRPLYYASGHVMDGFAQGILVETNLGRPTKIEGNPLHPDSLGATDAFAQASILTLYDPNRSQTVMHQGQISTWTDFLKDLRAQIPTLGANAGQGLRLLTESVTSPTLAAQIQQILTAFPRARWHRWQPVNRDTALAGAQLAFGQAVDTRYHFDAADVVLGLDADPFAWAPGRLAYMHDFAVRRRPETGRLSRVYAVESTPTSLGAAADHRLPLASGAIEAFAFALASALGVNVGAASVAAPSQVPAGWLDSVVADLRAGGPRALVVAGDFQPPAVHAVTHAINAALGSVGTTLEYTDPVEVDPVDHTLSLRQLVDDMGAGSVRLLLMMGVNPAYSAPVDVPFATNIAKVPTRVHMGLFEDETAALSEWHIPALHPLEDWGDARAYDGTESLLQPVIAPLYDAHSAHELLAAFSEQPAASSHDVVKSYWQTQHAAADFDSFWRTSLHDGVVSGSSLPTKTVSLQSHWTARITRSSPAQAGEVELVFRSDPSLYDGRFASNAWLLELPRPITRLSWDNVAMLSSGTAQRFGVTTGDVVELQSAGNSVLAPVWVQPGQANDSVAVTLGYGRARGAGAGIGVGFNAYGVRTANAPWFATGLNVVRTGQTHTLVGTQGHYTMEGHDLVLTVTQEQLQTAQSANVVAVGQQQPLESIYPQYAYPDNKWGMVIDLNACLGCNACILACQSENNIPVVGKEEVGRGREMHWLRVDTYYEGSDDNPRILQQPVPCMQCEVAPCELVCPVGATVHSAEGLNDQVYNRCVGTRYCSNNCPYKVRHFNFFQYADFDTPSLKLLHNPDVTVRSRGVMEKCTYCVQRINSARIQAETEDRPIRDGEVLTACQAACPTSAIVFGNLNDQASQVAQQRSLARNYTLLADLNTRPRTTYLATIRNPNSAVDGGG
jgi:molybdopterin-containing oxidoreductase family iron-sulfur binding subunit